MAALKPPSARLTQVSTEHVRPAERFDFWREVALVRSEPDLPAGQDRSAFRGTQRVLAGPGTRLLDRRTGPIILRRTPRRVRADGGDEIQLTAILETDSVATYHPEGTELRVAAAELALMDLAQPLTGTHEACRELVLLLPRTAVAAALGVDPARIGLRALRASPRIRLVQAQLRLVADSAAELDEPAGQAALDATLDLVLAMLRLESGQPGGTPETHTAGMLVAARRFTALHLGNPALRPAMIAHALGCSRTQLYRVFSAHGLAVMDDVQAMRLECAWRMLVAPAGHSIGEVAYRCGFEEPTIFSRSFRRRFGCTPSEARRVGKARGVAPGTK